MRIKIIQRLSGFSCIMLALCVALSATAAMAETAGAAKAALTAAAASKPRFTINLQASRFLTEGSVNETPQGPSFTVTRRDGMERKEKIGWRAVPALPKPVSAEDFEDGELPSGKLVFMPNASQSYEIYFESLPEDFSPVGILVSILGFFIPNDYYGLKNDGVKEGVEYFTIRLYDLDTGEDIPANFLDDNVFSVSDAIYSDEDK